MSTREDLSTLGRSRRVAAGAVAITMSIVWTHALAGALRPRRGTFGQRAGWPSSVSAR
jgi:hypothetical protein